MDNNNQNIYGNFGSPFKNEGQQNQGPFQFYTPNSDELSSPNTDNNIHGPKYNSQEDKKKEQQPNNNFNNLYQNNSLNSNSFSGQKNFPYSNKSLYNEQSNSVYSQNTEQIQVSQQIPQMSQLPKKQVYLSRNQRIIDEDFIRGRPSYTEYQYRGLINKNPKTIKIPNKEIIKIITEPKIKTTFEQLQEHVVDYGYATEKKIEQEVKTNPQNFIGIQEAISQKSSNKKLYVLGKLGESLQNMGIKVVIDKRENLKNDDDDYIINNQFISSGLIKKSKYEIHIHEENKIKDLILNNIKEQNFFIEKWRQRISNYVRVPKEDIYITNLRNGSITMDTIFKKIEFKDLDGMKLDIDEKMKNFANSNPKIISIFKKNILGACKLTLNMLDEEGNRDPKDWAKPGERRGGLEYFPPDSNWIGYGLKVKGLYDNKNNDWIGMNGNPNEWAVAYHGTSENAIKPICSQNGKFFSTVEEGAKGQKCKNFENVNNWSKTKYPICGEGTYCSPHLPYAKKYSPKGVIIMCRVNPKLIRIPKGQYEKDEWITDGTRDSIRPYRILCELNN